MILPFTPAQLIQIFRLYNEALWPLHAAGPVSAPP